MWHKLLIYFHTVRYLKLVQVYYRLYYFFINKWGVKPGFGRLLHKEAFLLDFTFKHSSRSYLGNKTFCFLNITHAFPKEINWEISAYGKLWQYNLCYFEFLNSNISKNEGLDLIHSFMGSRNELQSALEPYPISLRTINWIRFFSKNKIKEGPYIDFLFEQVELLGKRVEYHILGNHLLENAFAIYMAGVFFNERKYIDIGKRLIGSQLKEQILPDGAHFEQSPMYHQLILFRVLECLDIQHEKDEFIDLLKNYAAKMLGWLNAITFTNGDIPLVNDAAVGIAPTTAELNGFADLLQVQEECVQPGVSGYRMVRKSNYECFTDVGGVMATYQPGHTHADALSFILYINNKPILVDGGTSTYTIGERRQLERSTISHNTVTIDSKNQSQVWGGFRVARRAEVEVIKEQTDNIVSSHTGYGVKHTRSFLFSDKVEIIDTFDNRQQLCEAHFHFHPEVTPLLVGKDVEFEQGNICFENATTVDKETYLYAEAFNKTVKGIKLKVSFRNYLRIGITTSK